MTILFGHSLDIPSLTWLRARGSGPSLSKTILTPSSSVLLEFFALPEEPRWLPVGLLLRPVSSFSSHRKATKHSTWDMSTWFAVCLYGF